MTTKLTDPLTGVTTTTTRPAFTAAETATAAGAIGTLATVAATTYFEIQDRQAAGASEEELSPMGRALEILLAALKAKLEMGTTP